MDTPSQARVTPIDASIDDAGDWPAFAAQIATVTGMPTVVTPDIVTEFVAGAVPLLFEADGSGDCGPLRGTFSDAVVAQCQRNPGNLEGMTAQTALIHLVGAHAAEGHALLRVRLTIQCQGRDAGHVVSQQFWDMQIGGEVTVGQTQCPSCGAPLQTGTLVCGHCGADVRSVVSVPLIVAKLELY